MLKELAVAAAASLVLGGAALAAEGEAIKDVDFSFEGPFGSYDELELQRGLKVYTEVCAACHGLKYVPIRTIGDEGGPGLPEEQVRAYAAGIQVFDRELNNGEGDYLDALPTDNFPASQMASAPDLSLMAKARAGFSGPYGTGINQLLKGLGGPEYIVAILEGYTGETKEEAGAVLYENTAFPGGWISMPQPMAGGEVEFDDGAPNDLEAQAKDVAAFLMWTAEPKLEARKHAGFVAVLFLGLLAVLLYLTNKRIWRPIKGRNDAAAE
ncbi:MAG: cytochrome c1 [Tranquillimonas sp.]